MPLVWPGTLCLRNDSKQESSENKLAWTRPGQSPPWYKLCFPLCLCSTWGTFWQPPLTPSKLPVTLSHNRAPLKIDLRRKRWWSRQGRRLPIVTLWKTSATRLLGGVALIFAEVSISMKIKFYVALKNLLKTSRLESKGQSQHTDVHLIAKHG